MKHFALKQLCCFCVLLCMQLNAHAQDTLRVTLPEAEKLFLDNNLQLLAERYQIDISKAAIIQARLYNNPTFNFNGSLYDPVQKKVFNVSDRNGQYFFAVEQVIRLAGKRNKGINVAMTESAMTESSFYDLLRTLQFELRTNFFELHYTYQSYLAYQRQINSLEKLNQSYQQLRNSNTVSQKDAVRIKSLLYTLKAEQSALLATMVELQGTLQLLLQNNNAWHIPMISQQTAGINDLILPALIDTAYSNRADLRLARQSITWAEQQYRLEKAMAVPDLTLGVEFDKRSNYIDNATLFSVAIDLPFFHRNQGNIKAAAIRKEQTATRLKFQEQSLANEVQTAYGQLLVSDRMLSSIDTAFAAEYERLMQGVTDNFIRKNISLLEFTDFIESYKNSFIELNKLSSNRVLAMEALNYAVGKRILN